ncbi:MAG: hypothetical protein M1533_00470 [Candidatus Thermoplasmatota archaeon]|nr:hypothetical protein [Candidatus Thermoplasmatota archaeon]MCL5794277.1 hypothetical protein [Candidatus Thermoplasmatota archaeon]
MPGEKTEIEKRCMFHSDSECHLNEQFVTRCSLCFNFATPVPPDRGRYSQSRPLFYLSDYLRSGDMYDVVFPRGTSIQGTIRLD